MPAEQLPTGTIILKPPKDEPTGVAVYARVSSADQRDQRADLDGQVARVRAVEFDAQRLLRGAHGNGGGIGAQHGHRPKLMKVLADHSIAMVAVEPQSVDGRLMWSASTWG